MGKNIEIKARCLNEKFVQLQIEKLNARFEGSDHQVDTFFKTKNGRLKLRESSLCGNLLIPYLRNDKSGPKQSDYSLIKIGDLVKTKLLLTEILGQKVVVEKERKIYIYKNVRIHLDNVKNLGAYIELEAVVDSTYETEECRQTIKWLSDLFQISEEDLITGAYADLLLAG